jgi:hypothetical protein
MCWVQEVSRGWLVVLGSLGKSEKAIGGEGQLFL